MARKKQEMLSLFPDVLSFTRKFTDAQFGALIRAAFAYRFGGEEYSGDDAAVDVAFRAVADQIDRLAEYSRTNSKNARGRENRQKGAECSEMQGNAGESPSIPIHSIPIHSIPTGGTEDKADKPPTRTRFSPPSVQDVADYCREKGYAVDAEHFVDYYSSVGWKRGKTPVRDWKATVRTWARKDSQQSAAPEPKDCGYVLAPLEDPYETAMRGRDNV